MQNVKVYRGKNGIKDINELFTATNNETICFLRKSCIQHWALINLPQRFVVTTKNTWDPHPVNITQIGGVGPNDNILADNEKGPCIIEHRNTLSTLFHIDDKHPETINVVVNFVRHYTMLIHVLFLLF